MPDARRVQIGDLNAGFSVIAVMPAVYGQDDIYVTAQSRRKGWLEFVTWATTRQFGVRGCYSGHYYDSRRAALTDMARRAGVRVVIPRDDS